MLGKALVLMFVASFLQGCSSIVKGDTQTLSVDTPKCKKAECKLTNDQGTYFVPSTPGTIMLNKSSSPLAVECTKDNNTQIISVESSTESMAFGNIIAGGIIGAAVDMSTGAAYVYPPTISHPLVCE